MSDSMAFLGGAAAAGLAAIVLLKGAATPNLSNLPTSPQLQSPPVQSPAFSPTGQVPPVSPYPGSGFAQPGQIPVSPYPTSYNAEQQQLDIARLKFQLEQQQAQTEQLKVQLQNQQLYIDSMNSQVKASGLAAQVNPAQSLALSQAQNPMPSGIVWAVGGVLLTIGGGILVVGTIALLSQQRRPRTVQVIHPMNNGLAPLTPTRRTEYLPSRLETRRVSRIEYEE